MSTDLTNPAGTTAAPVQAPAPSTETTTPVAPVYNPGVGIFGSSWNPMNLVAAVSDKYYGLAQQRLEATEAYNVAKEALLNDDLVNSLKEGSQELQAEHEELLAELNTANSRDPEADKAKFDSVSEKAKIFAEKVKAEGTEQEPGFDWAFAGKAAVSSLAVLGGAAALYVKRDDVQKGLTTAYETSRDATAKLADAVVTKLAEQFDVAPDVDKIDFSM